VGGRDQLKHSGLKKKGKKKGKNVSSAAWLTEAMGGVKEETLISGPEIQVQLNERKEKTAIARRDLFLRTTDVTLNLVQVEEGMSYYNYSAPDVVHNTTVTVHADHNPKDLVPFFSKCKGDADIVFGECSVKQRSTIKAKYVKSSKEFKGKAEKRRSKEIAGKTKKEKLREKGYKEHVAKLNKTKKIAQHKRNAMLAKMGQDMEKWKKERIVKEKKDKERVAKEKAVKAKAPERFAKELKAKNTPKCKKAVKGALATCESDTNEGYDKCYHIYKKVPLADTPQRTAAESGALENSPGVLDYLFEGMTVV